MGFGCGVRGAGTIADTEEDVVYRDGVVAAYQRRWHGQGAVRCTAHHPRAASEGGRTCVIALEKKNKSSREEDD